MKLSVIVPTFNESDTILKILTKVLKQKVFELIIVDDGSIDNSKNIIQSSKLWRNNKKKVKFLIHPKNLGKGAAIRTAIKKVKGDYLIIQDADLEYDPTEYKLLLKHASLDKAVYGSRLLISKSNKKAYFYTYLGNLFITTAFNLLFGQSLTDSYTCYKLLPTKVAKDLNLTSNGFEIEAEITAKLAKKGIKIIEVPINYSPRKYEQGKKIKGRDALKGFLKYLQIRFFDKSDP